MKNYTVARNEAYQASEFNIRERHNERKNESYYNADIIPEQANLNVHFRRHLTPDGTPETYEQTFNRLLENGTIIKRGLKADAKVFDELVFDVNSAYFEENGGYEYAKKFFAEAYRLAVKEVGGEEYILSAVMHSDEKNIALSEQHGRDVFHYHLHVVYVPVVQKEVRWSKRCKDPALVGTVKEVIPQISHSKKWVKFKDENGKWINEYSLLQDRYFEHMKSAGFEGFKRGERGSTSEHLSVLDYKIQQDKKRLDAVSIKVERKENRLKKLDEQIAVKEKAKATIADVEAMGKLTPFGNFSMSADELTRLKTLAKKSVNADRKISEARKKVKDMEDTLAEIKSELAAVKSELVAEQKKRVSIGDHTRWFSKFMAAMKRAPGRLMAVIDEILRQPPERAEPERGLERGNVKGGR